MGNELVYEFPQAHPEPSLKDRPLKVPGYFEVQDMRERAGEDLWVDANVPTVLAKDFYHGQNARDDAGDYYSIDPLSGRVVLSDRFDDRVEQMPVSQFVGGVLFALAERGELHGYVKLSPELVNDVTYQIGGLAVHDFRKSIEGAS